MHHVGLPEILLAGCACRVNVHVLGHDLGAVDCSVVRTMASARHVEDARPNDRLRYDKTHIFLRLNLTFHESVTDFTYAFPLFPHLN